MARKYARRRRFKGRGGRRSKTIKAYRGARGGIRL